MDKAFEKQTHITVPIKKRKPAHKKREIRVFVSSTFKDFMDEREEIIKKAFREVCLSTSEVKDLNKTSVLVKVGSKSVKKEISY